MNAVNPLSPDKRGGDRKTYEPSMEEILASIRRIIADDQAFAARPPAVPQAAHQQEAAAAPVDVLEAENPLRRQRFAKAGVAAPDVQTDSPRSEVEGLDVPTQDLPQPEVARADIPRADIPRADIPRPRVAREPSRVAEAPASAPAVRFTSPSVAPFPVEAQFQFFKSAAVSRRVEPAIESLPAEIGPPEPQPAPKAAVAPESSLRSAPAREHLHQPHVATAPLPEAPDDHEPPLVSPETDAAVASAFNALVASQLMPSSEALDDMVREMIRPMLKAWLDDNLPVLVERLVRAEIERVARGGR